MLLPCSHNRLVQCSGSGLVRQLVSLEWNILPGLFIKINGGHFLGPAAVPHKNGAM